MKRLNLFEAPISDYLPDEFKQYARQSAKQSEEAGIPANTMEFQRLMMGLPSIERSNKNELVQLAINSFYDMYPDIEKLVDEGKIILDADLGGGSGGRSLPQNISPQELQKAKEEDPEFEERVKMRHYQNAFTQGKAWVNGFNHILRIEDELENIDPRLYDMYRSFSKGASKFYWENTEMLERMAAQATGRVAYCDVTFEPDGKVKIEARAPVFPLLLHELVKGAEYYRSLFSLPKSRQVSKALTSTTDVHKHEIKNMNYGRALVNRIREILNKDVKGYSHDMEPHLISELESELTPKEFNEIMDGIVKNDQKMILKFVVKCERIVKDL
jgi:hypothetical protein